MFSVDSPHISWDKVNRRKIRHRQIREVEVAQAFADRYSDIRRTARGTYTPKYKRYILIGQSESGRLLKIPFDVIEGKVRPVTAYDAGKRDHALYWRHR